MTSQSQGGFTLIELIVVIIVLGIVAAMAVPRFVGLPDDAHKAQVKATAGSMRTSINLIKGKARVSEVIDTHYGDPTFEYSYGGKTGEVAMHPDMTGAPVDTSDFIDGYPTNSETLWDLMVRSPSIKEEDSTKETGWYSTSSSVTDSYVYAWDYYVSGQLFARLKYDAREDVGRGSVEIIWKY